MNDLPKLDAGTGGSIEALLGELLDRITNGHKQSIGSIDNVRMVQFGVDEIARYRERLAALLTRRDHPDVEKQKLQSEIDGLLAVFDAHGIIRWANRPLASGLAMCLQSMERTRLALIERAETAERELATLQGAAATRRDAPQEPHVSMGYRDEHGAHQVASVPLAVDLYVSRLQAEIETLRKQVGRDADAAKEPGVIENLKNALEKFMEASQLPETCVHDAEPDYCDGCRYAMEKAMQMARIHARAALETIPAAPPVAAKEPER